MQKEGWMNTSWLLPKIQVESHHRSKLDHSNDNGENDRNSDKIHKFMVKEEEVLL
jgi:hypothetical protein